MDFRSRLVATLRAAEGVLGVPGVLVVGSEVPNLLQPGAASTLVVSQDVDLGVLVTAHGAVKARLGGLRGMRPSPEEPSVWLPETPGLIELNFIGIDPRIDDPTRAYVLEDPELPLMVFGALAFVRRGRDVDVDGLLVPVPEPAGLILEKLLTDRSGIKGDRDLLVVAGLLAVAGDADLDEIVSLYASKLADEPRYLVRSNLTLLSMMAPQPGMPDPVPHRARVAELLRRVESGGAT